MLPLSEIKTRPQIEADFLPSCAQNERKMSESDGSGMVRRVSFTLSFKTVNLAGRVNLLSELTRVKEKTKCKAKASQSLIDFWQVK